LIEILDENIAMALVDKGILFRISRFLISNELPQIWILVGKILSFSKIRQNIHSQKVFLKKVL